MKAVAAAGTLVNVPGTAISAKLLDDACAVIPGGVNSPVRAFKAVGGTPRFITEANGYWLTDADGNRYVDLVCSWGPMILGHAHPSVVEAVTKAAASGLSFGAPTPAESELAAEKNERAESDVIEQVLRSLRARLPRLVNLRRRYRFRERQLRIFHHHSPDQRNEEHTQHEADDESALAAEHGADDHEQGPDTGQQHDRLDAVPEHGFLPRLT